MTRIMSRYAALNEERAGFLDDLISDKAEIIESCIKRVGETCE